MNTLLSRVIVNETQGLGAQTKHATGSAFARAEEAFGRWYRPLKAKQPEPTPVPYDERHRRRERIIMWLLAAAILFGLLVLMTSTVAPAPVPASSPVPATTHVAAAIHAASGDSHLHQLSPDTWSASSQWTSGFLPWELGPLLFNGQAPVHHRHSSGAARIEKGAK